MGILINDKLNWKTHTHNIVSKRITGNSILFKLRSHVNKEALLHFRTPLFLLMILMQNFILIKNHIETWVWNQQKWSYSPLKFCNFFISLTIKTLPVHLFCSWKRGFLALCLWLYANFNASISIARSFNDFNYLLLCIISRNSQSHMFYKIRCS